MINSGHESLRNQFLIAMPMLSEGIFKSSVTYICEHNEDGAMGIIINRPLDLTLKDILEDFQMESHSALGSTPVFAGGPVALERGFVLHQQSAGQEWKSSLVVTDEVAMTVSKDILAALMEGNGPSRFLVALGYAGWGAGQLEQELADNAWLTAPMTMTTLFDLDFHKKAAAAAESLGVDLSRVSMQSGSA